MKTALNNFGLRSRQFRNQLGMTLADQAAKLGIAPSEISRFETTESPVCLRYVERVCNLFDLDLLQRQEMVRLAARPRCVETIAPLNRKQSDFLAKQLGKLRDFTPAQIAGLPKFIHGGLSYYEKAPRSS